MTTWANITGLEHGTWIDSPVWNALLTDPQTERPLMWCASIDDVASEWQDHEGIGHLAQLVKGLRRPGGFMAIKDGEPETRYVARMRGDGGNFTVEIGMCVPNGALNLRKGKSAGTATEPSARMRRWLPCRSSTRQKPSRC